MAHKIYFNPQNAQHSFFSVKEKPWHEVGQIIEAYPTSKEALTFAGLKPDGTCVLSRVPNKLSRYNLSESVCALLNEKQSTAIKSSKPKAE
ncbi:MAG: hypothetical protein ABIN48_08310 [Ginsengibacter sp.]